MIVREETVVTHYGKPVTIRADDEFVSDRYWAMSYTSEGTFISCHPGAFERAVLIFTKGGYGGGHSPGCTWKSEPASLWPDGFTVTESK